MTTATTTRNGSGIRERFIIRNPETKQYLKTASVRYQSLHTPGAFMPVWTNDRSEAHLFEYLIDAKRYADILLNRDSGPYSVEVDFDAPM